MAQDPKTGILNLVKRKGSVTIRPNDLAREAKLSGCNHVKVNEALDALVRAGKITRSFDQQTGRITLRSANIRS